MSEPKHLRSLRETAFSLSKALGEHLKEAGSKPPLHREVINITGKHLWPLTYKGASGDREAFGRMAAYFEYMANNSPKGSLPYITAMGFLYLPDQQITNMFAARWVDQGLPTIQMGHKYAAALMATSIEKADLSEIPVPWKAFIIDVPQGLLSVENDGKLHEVRHILVHHQVDMQDHPTWTYLAATDSNVTLWQHGLPMDQLVKDFGASQVAWEEYSFGYATTDRDERVNLLIGRLIVGVCLALSGKDRPIKKVGKAHKFKGDLRRTPEPLHRVFKIGNPITLDCRPAVEGFLEGRTGSKPNVQTLVRGHWKRQPCGPGNKDRKWVQIEPYWRGPDDAPIIQRPHKL